jgi:Fe-S-cluster containining protein
MSAGELKRRFLKRVGLRITIIEDAFTHDCVFLRQGESGKVCMIYPVRPKQCRDWPFWPGNLISPDTWNMAARKCPGVNRGENYTPGQIQARNDEVWWKSVAK